MAAGMLRSDLASHTGLWSSDLAPTVGLLVAVVVLGTSASAALLAGGVQPASSAAARRVTLIMLGGAHDLATPFGRVLGPIPLGGAY